MKKAEVLGTLVTLILATIWGFNPNFNIEPIIVFVAAITSLYAYASRNVHVSSFVNEIVNRNRNYYFTVNRDGKAIQVDKDISSNITNILDSIRKNKKYRIHVKFSEKSNLVESSNEGIRATLTSEDNKKLEDVSNLLDLLIQSWSKELIPNSSLDNLIEIVKGALRVISLNMRVDPSKEYLDIWFTHNMDFRTQAILEPAQAYDLLKSQGVSHFMQMMGGWVQELPNNILYSEVIPKIYFALQKNSDKRGFESAGELFNLKRWEYGVG